MRRGYTRLPGSRWVHYLLEFLRIIWVHYLLELSAGTLAGPDAGFLFTPAARSGDCSHGSQRVFWTCLDQIVMSRDMTPKNTGFMDRVKMKMGMLPNSKIKFYA